LQSIQAEAAVTGTLPTNDVYNNQNVVLIRPADGPVVETAFRSDDFNVYPPRNRTAPYGEWRSAAANAFLAQPAKEAPRFRTGVVNRQELPGRCGRLGQNIDEVPCAATTSRILVGTGPAGRYRRAKSHRTCGRNRLGDLEELAQPIPIAFPANRGRPAANRHRGNLEILPQ
jgi:hypothetical protein